MMLTKWFESPESRSLKKDRSIRLSLESLEERNAPSAGGIPGPPDHDHDHGPPHPPIAGPVNNGAIINTSASAGNGNHGSFNNSTITDSFNNTITNNVNITLNAGQSSAVMGLLGVSGLLSSALSSPNLGSLLNDEIAMAVDNYLTNPMVSSALGLSTSTINTLTTDAKTLASAIAANPLEATPVGAFLGMLAYDTTTDALVSAGV
jgi:hypothetical protein